MARLLRWLWFRERQRKKDDIRVGLTVSPISYASIARDCEKFWERCATVLLSLTVVVKPLNSQTFEV